MRSSQLRRSNPVLSIPGEKLPSESIVPKEIAKNNLQPIFVAVREG
jgi:hypothetical protein